MTLRFQADADLNQRIVSATVRLEPAIDFRSAVDGALAGLDDAAVLASAAADGRVLVTHDLKTMPRHFGDFVQTASSPGVIVLPQRMPIGVAAEHLILIWSATQATEWVDRIYVVPPYPSSPRIT